MHISNLEVHALVCVFVYWHKIKRKILSIFSKNQQNYYKNFSSVGRELNSIQIQYMYIILYKT